MWTRLLQYRRRLLPPLAAAAAATAVAAATTTTATTTGAAGVLHNVAKPALAYVGADSGGGGGGTRVLRELDTLELRGGDEGNGGGGGGGENGDDGVDGDDGDGEQVADGVDKEKIKVFAGSANRQLAGEVASLLGIELGGIAVDRFSDGEVRIRVQDNIRGKDVYVLQPTAPPVNDNIIELLMLVSTMRRASARRITAVLPYYGYGRQDRKREARETIAAADVARLLEAVGVDRVLCVDLHSGQTQGFFRKLTAVENLSTFHDLMVPYFLRKKLHRPVIVSPSGTGLQRIRRIRDEFHLQGVETGLAFVAPRDDRGSVVVAQVAHHHRVHDQAAMILVGDVHDCDVIIVDDMVDTGSRMRLAARTAKQNGAKRVYAVCTHGLFSAPNFDRLLAASDIRELVVTNTIAKPDHVRSAKVHYLSVAPMIADAVYRLHRGLPLSSLVADAY